MRARPLTLLALAGAIGLAGCGHGRGEDAALTGFERRLSHSAPVRLVRCALAQPVRLTSPGARWRIDYRVQGTRAAPSASFSVALDSEGVIYRDGERLRAPLPPVELERLAAEIDRSDLECAATVPLTARRPAAPGRRSLELSTPTAHRLLSEDRCFGVSDPLAWAAAETALEPLFAVAGRLRPPPLANAPIIEGVCGDEALIALEDELDR